MTSRYGTLYLPIQKTHWDVAKWYDRDRHLNSNNYLIVMIAQMVVVLAPAVFAYIPSSLVAIVATTLVVMISAYILSSGRSELAIASMLGLAAIAFGWANEGTPGTMFSALDNFSSGAFYVYAAILLVRRVIETQSITRNVLYAAISGFLFLGLVGGHLIRLIDVTTEGAFNLPADADTYSYTYFSFVTITTLGYGDITPQNATAQAVTVLLAICGQMYITTVIAVIVGRLSSK